MARISTHVLDTAEGRPAVGVRVDFYRHKAGRADLLRSTVTNADGRTDEPLLAGDEIPVGIYEIVFHAGPYFESRAAAVTIPSFLDEVVVRFGVADAKGTYHVPLLMAPHGYTTYRGS
jgi:5-hydroxyisourate hydrolase